ncbi:VCBS repeat-containing protein [Yeosuana sp. MJ-SS3]|uniref:VCBS repeat-containing protein n=1 Tax=Gilvirhabdus luticola TaxID=3079858 RepID=A0ABU3U6U5_9FLAO|nr:VCBS repeat-containing protein [Yeosuana sp. MJ-SS3]MDU8886034.1 VCBS repeat-containing protein [Yeosuana sp. MJ-SS3]
MKTLNYTLYIALSIAFLLIFSCKKNVEESSSYLFDVVSSDHTNIHFKNTIPVNKLTNSFIYEYVYNGGGVAIGDINNDGLDDIYFTSNLEDNQLYLNLGNLEFDNITELSNTKGKRGWATGTNMIDINNDGLLDIYVCRSGPYPKPTYLANELFLNKGNNADGIPVFEESAELFGLADRSNSIQSAFIDFDLDGDLDMYLMNHNPQTFSLTNKTDAFSPLGDKFYVNEDGKYIDKTAEVGIYSNSVSYGLGVGISDLNLDGWPDIYISNDYDEPDYMYINQKDGTFSEVIKKATNHIANFSMGNDIADFDNDGYMDVMTLDMVSEDNYGMKTSMASMNPEKFNKNVEAGKHYQYMYNVLLKHSTHIDSLGIPFYSDIGQIAGISNTDWSWAPLLADFDNDGLKDLFITNGIKKDFRNKDYYNMMKKYRSENPDALSNEKKITYLLEEMPSRPHKNYFYKNDGGLTFKNTSDIWMQDPSKTLSNGAAYADLDNDGDLDLVINNVDEEALILRNNTNETSNHINFEFRGLPKNSMGIGVKAIIYANNQQQVFENYSVRGYQSSVPPKIYVGLGEISKVDSVQIYWPNHKVQKLSSPEINKLITIYYAEDKVVQVSNTGKENTLFTFSKVLSNLKHIENDYDDYKEQVLLPHKMSQFGPAIAVGDINSDGLEDIYFGQSTGSVSSIFIQNSNGDFKEIQTFEEDAIYEDIDAEFFDFDKDGDLDLYVASGGNEFEPNSQNYADRLYENKNGILIKRMDLLPSDLRISSSRIRIADYDNNGYPDLFVGGRLIPHDYPNPESSYILKNNNGHFEDVTQLSAPGLINIGLVTDATWTDFDSDGDYDLCLVGEWMQPTFFENDNNILNKVEFENFEKLSGWYYSIKAIDIDNDGDEDYIVGNLGENYKYKANSTEPFEVYYHDFDDNGRRDIVLSYYNFGELFPVRGKSCSTEQIPDIKKIIPTYDQFGKSTVADIYGEENLKESLRLLSYNFKSGILKNNGSGNFEFINLPEIAQISSVNDILIYDVDQDQDLDIILAGNLFTSEIETPRNDAGYGMVLVNEGNFNFKPINVNYSGLFLPNDVKNLRLINIKNKPHILVGNNNDVIQVLKLNIQ